jgi:hypothetical protein
VLDHELDAVEQVTTSSSACRLGFGVPTGAAINRKLGTQAVFQLSRV